MKFKFSLEKVLNHRRIQMDLARKDYLDALAFLQNEQEIHQQMIDLKNKALNERANLVKSSTQWQMQVEQLNLFIKGQDLRIAQQNERLLKIEKLVESRREILKDSLTEVKIMERLKEKKKADFLQEVKSNEQKELDEISTIRFVRMTKEN
ncbi:MAG: flagellar export protein FliJ [Pseudobdellovibrio sp.]